MGNSDAGNDTQTAARTLGRRTRSRKTRRRKIGWLALAALLLMLALSLRWALQPSQLGGLIIDRVGDALDLQISVEAIDYNLVGGTPSIVVHGLIARQAGAQEALLRATRVYLSLPWSTILARGEDLTVQRVEIDAPTLDVAALQRWRASRPPSEELRIPTLVDGLRITRGTVIGDSWSIDRIRLGLPELHPRQPLRMHVRGRFRNGGTRVPFDLRVALTRPAVGAGLGAVGSAALQTDDWRMPMTLQLSGRLRNAGDGFGLDGFRYGAKARYLGADVELPLVFGVAGPLRYRAGRFSITPLAVVLHGDETIPTLDARGMLAWQGALDLRLAGALAGWPDAWPALPAPLNGSDAPLPFELDYAGPADLSGTTALQLSRGKSHFDARFRLPQVRQWLDTLATGTPLPPLEGRFVTPELEIAGATLEGVEIEFETATGSEEGDE